MIEEETFTMLDELGIERPAKILNVIDINNQEYLVYSISKNEAEDSIFASKIIKNSTGEEELQEITNEDERAVVFETIRNIINELN